MNPQIMRFASGPDPSSGEPQHDPAGPTEPSAPRPPRHKLPQQLSIWLAAAGIVGVIVLATLLFAATLMESPKKADTSAPSSGTAHPAGAPIQSAAPTATHTVIPAISLTSTLTPSIAAPGSQTPNAPVQTSAAIPAGTPACLSIGQTWVRSADKMVMQCVPAGSFPMGIDKCTFAGCEKEIKGGNVDLPAYWIDRSEVTNSMFQEFVNQTGYITGAENIGASEVYGLLTAIQGANWRAPQGIGSSISAKMNHPVVQMNWFAANAYCKWAGGRLPSEAEWEKAARGKDGRLWPWGNTLPSDKLVNAADKSLPEPHSRTDQDDGFRYTSPVGAFPAGQSPYGLMDMAGNAWEWTRSVFRDYPYLLNDGREILSAPGAGDRMVLRGGSWFDDYGALRSTMRYGGLPEGSTDGTGFRCVFP